MASPFIEYRTGYKYQLASNYSLKTTIKPASNVDEEFIKLDTAGNLTVESGYAWDGPSGPVEDTPENMRASLVHDALYQLMRSRKLTIKEHKEKADKLFKKICIEDGVPKVTAEIYYLGLKLGGKPTADPKNKKKVHRAPDPAGSTNSAADDPAGPGPGN
ncbi:MAG: DUF1353 domain-containing protein [Chromatiales bacterium]|nr:DUF1353 domain-containing protein [Chromatiales bacterium]